VWVLLVLFRFCPVLVSFFWGNLISIFHKFQLLTDHVSHLSGNAGKKNHFVFSRNPEVTGCRFFLLVAAWVDPGRSALQSAEQWCKGRYGRIHQVGKMSIYDKNMQKGRLKQHTN